MLLRRSVILALVWLAMLLVGCMQPQDGQSAPGTPSAESAEAIEEAALAIREIEELAREVQGLCDEMRGRGTADPREAGLVLADLKKAVTAAQANGERAQTALGKARDVLRVSGATIVD